MKQAMTAALALALGACTAEAPPPEPRMGGLPEGFPPTILTDMAPADRQGVEAIIARYSDGLRGHCTGDQIAAALATPTIATWFVYAVTRSPASVAYVEANGARLAGLHASLPEGCRNRVADLADSDPA